MIIETITEEVGRFPLYPGGKVHRQQTLAKCLLQHVLITAFLRILVNIHS